MVPPSLPTLLAAMDATWPPKAAHEVGPWTLREGSPGIKRTTAATARAPVTDPDIDAAERAMRGFGQTPLFQIRPEDEALDAALDRRGYRIVDPVHLMIAPVAALARPVPHLATIPAWPPLAVQRELWAAGGIGPNRVAVMDRVQGDKTALLSRTNDRPSGAAFVARDGDIALIHAVLVAPAFRRQGSANHMLWMAANWARDVGAKWLALAVAVENTGARNLYASQGMEVVGHYHYRSV